MGWLFNIHLPFCLYCNPLAKKKEKKRKMGFLQENIFILNLWPNDLQWNINIKNTTANSEGAEALCC